MIPHANEDITPDMDVAQGEEVGGDDRIQTYPSPTANNQETTSHFDHDGAENVAHDVHDVSHEVTHDVIDESLYDGTHDDHTPHPHDSDANARELQHHEPSGPQHHASHAASVEELQLAAQLGQDLASEPLLPVTDPNMKFDDPNLRGILPQAEDTDMRNDLTEPEDSQSHAFTSEEPDSVSLSAAPLQSAPQPSLQAAMPQASIQQTPMPQAQMQNTMQQAPMQPNPIQQNSMQAPIQQQNPTQTPMQTPMQTPNQTPMQNSGQVPINHHHPQPYPQNNQDDSTPPRKRSKVSRACDECRRKKVKCDAQSDLGDNPCSNCRRSAQRCSFSRIPQKRGPSKGYIKELADRIHSIEGRLCENTGEEASRKRTFSSISSADITTPTAPRQPPSTWSSEPREVDDANFQGYLTMVHPYLPILPASKTRLQVYLAQCPGMLREAFLEALHGTMQSFPSFTTMGMGDASLAMKMLVEWEMNGEEPRTSAAHFIHLQTLLLLFIEASNRPSSCAGHIKESLLGRAVSTAWTMKLYSAQAGSSLELNGDVDVDSDTHLRVRLWWSLVLLDRWNAVGSGTLPMTRTESTVVSPDVAKVVGETTWQLIRASKILNQACNIISGARATLGSVTFADEVLGGVLNDYVENFREDLPPHIEPAVFPVVHLAYWHSRLLAYMCHPASKATDLLWPCKELVSLVAVTPHVSSPMSHHFTALPAMALIELTKVEEIKEEAFKLLKELRSLLTSPAAWDIIVSDKIADHLRSMAKSQGLLQQLADIAASSAAEKEQEQEQASEQAPELKAKIESSGGGAAAAEEVGEDGLPTYRLPAAHEDTNFDPRYCLTAGYLKSVWTIWASNVQA
ncbi:transcriptional activator [Verticillium nonalfalfae]|uniref:Transcriptional activator n=1 Tax=Verticillium nonalfalfae TaxID=1051616 RepID=A0A3M9Y094_9PEZI|nr:transcriptional activator [Verticillium nonalfalfae]RNJ53939.1 transcriptional activator [Verticillium nonalfalfae]